jgi:hypothetical protein
VAPGKAEEYGKLAREPGKRSLADRILAERRFFQDAPVPLR